ncbi:BlaI/MecI/CopY family transcriptional regulator [Frankia sp. Cr2]|uniref:BlaI/MecI/CopY family transcriptional regulator n=1 Tax=Frankia sp. Cr2 TaxID=3073932 RepID=UPI002AD3B637|nr:BlaI/MecI/CopY family transcriptional regulator [Frankia sp. Cr2]
MARLGDLERSVMDVLWDTDGWLTAREVAVRLDHERDLAYTTVLTVLERLERKGFVQRERAERAHRYQASSSRDAVVAEAMLAVLDTTDDRNSALVRFVGSVSPAEAEILRRALTRPTEAGQDALGQDTREPETMGPETMGQGTKAPGTTTDQDTTDQNAHRQREREEAGPPGRGIVHPL